MFPVMMTVTDRKNQTTRKVTRIYVVCWMIERIGDFCHFHIIRDPVCCKTDYFEGIYFEN